MTIETFISYARKDGLTYAEYLERALPNTWRDKRNLDPFKDFTAEIERAIDACRQVVAVITSDTTRDNSFVRRELAYAAYRKKPIIIVRFVDVPPPLNVFNHTWLDWFNLGWDETLDQIREWMGAFVPTYSPPALTDVLAADPHREYLGALYDSIVDYLDRVIIKEVTLKTKHIAGAVAKSKPALLGGFYRRAGLNASEERIETLQEGLEHFKGRLLLLGDPGAGKTVSVLATARDAVVRRLNDPAAPLPILLRCAEWPSDPPRPLSDWVQEQVGLTMTTFGDVFVFFDGFDELGTSRIRKVKDEKGNERDESYDPRPLFLDIIPKAGRVLLSCRIKEYEDFGTKVDLNGAVTLRPLTETQIQEYLADLPDLWEALSSETELLQVMKTPLLLSLFAFGYKDAPDAAKALRDLNAVQLSEAIFKQYVHKRYAHEALRLEDMGQTPPFTLEEIYDVLGHVAMINASGAYGVKDNVLEDYDFQSALEDKARVQEFTAFASLINLITPIEDAFRFIHLRLRDHFVRLYCYPRIIDEELYSDWADQPNPVRALANLPNNEALDFIMKHLTHSDISITVRREIIYVLSLIGDSRTVNYLIPYLDDVDESIRINVAVTLGEIGDNNAVDPLIIALKDKSPDMRICVASALGTIKDVRAVEPLIAAVDDVDNDVRIAVIEALGTIRDTRAIKPIILSLKDKDEMVRIAVAKALGKLKATEAIEPLKILLSDSIKISDQLTFWGEQTPGLYAQFALEDIGTPEALAALEEWRKRQRGE